MTGKRRYLGPPPTSRFTSPYPYQDPKSSTTSTSGPQIPTVPRLADDTDTEEYHDCPETMGSATDTDSKANIPSTADSKASSSSEAMDSTSNTQPEPSKASDATDTRHRSSLPAEDDWEMVGPEGDTDSSGEIPTEPWPSLSTRVWNMMPSRSILTSRLPTWAGGPKPAPPVPKPWGPTTKGKLPYKPYLHHLSIYIGPLLNRGVVREGNENLPYEQGKYFTRAFDEEIHNTMVTEKVFLDAKDVDNWRERIVAGGYKELVQEEGEGRYTPAWKKGEDGDEAEVQAS